MARILGSFSGRFRPWEWLRLEGSYGTDRLNRLDNYYEFRGYQTRYVASLPPVGGATVAASHTRTAR
mgnify:CR=1 FL=1